MLELSNSENGRTFQAIPVSSLWHVPHVQNQFGKGLSSVGCAVSLRAVRRHADIDDAAAVCRSICALTKKVRLGTPGHNSNLSSCPGQVVYESTINFFQTVNVVNAYIYIYIHMNIYIYIIYIYILI